MTMMKNIKLKKKPGVLFHQWKNLKLVFYSRYLCLMISNCSYERSFFSSKSSKESTAFVYGPKKVEFLRSTLH